MSSTSSSPGSPAGNSTRNDDRRTLPVRDKDSSTSAAGKRKRTQTNGAQRGVSRRRTQQPSEQPGSDDDDDRDNADQYDPDQPIEERREVQRGLRQLREDARVNRDKYMKPGDNGLRRILRKANVLSSSVKQTTEAAIDSRLLVDTAEMSYKKTALLTSGDAGQGVDVDAFVTQCLRYMRLGAGIVDDDAPELTSTQRQRRRPTRGERAGSDDEDEIGDDGDPCNWEHLGRFVCLPQIRRPATPGFLLGPLSVEKKVRKIAKRTAPFRHNNLRETRPEVLEAKDIQKNEDNDLTAICRKILGRLTDLQTEAQEAAANEFDAGNQAEGYRIMADSGLRDTGGIDFFKFVINPKSFGQTIENMFYVSFLIRDSKAELEFDENGFPTISPTDGQEPNPLKAKHASQKHQAILHLDMVVWQDLIEAFDIKESIIEHRKEQASNGPGARGWYN